MRLFGKRRSKEEYDEQREARQKAFFEYGEKISYKLGLPDKVQKINAYYAKHPRGVSFAILGWCFLMVIISMIPTTCNRHHDELSKTMSENPSMFTGNTLVSSMNRHMENMDKLAELAKKREYAAAIADSLNKLENLSKEDSITLNACNKFLNELKDSENGKQN